MGGSSWRERQSWGKILEDWGIFQPVCRMVGEAVPFLFRETKKWNYFSFLTYNNIHKGSG